jgi:hypothetical protein
MTRSPLVALAAPTALVTGGLLVVTQFVQLATIDRDDKTAMLANPVYVANAIAQFVAFALLPVVAVAAYAWQSDRAGRLGVAGLVAAIFGTVSLAGNYWFEAFAVPWLADAAPDALTTPPSGVLLLGGASSYLLFAVGWVLFGIASLRARVFPTAISVAVIVGGVAGIQAVQPPLGVPLGLALVWLGGWMVRREPAPVPAPAVREARS